jgi:hypothetical protein
MVLRDSKLKHSQTESRLESNDGTGCSEITVRDNRDLDPNSSLRAQRHMYKIYLLHCLSMYVAFPQITSNIQIQQLQ